MRVHFPFAPDELIAISVVQLGESSHPGQFTWDLLQSQHITNIIQARGLVVKKDRVRFAHQGKKVSVFYSRFVCVP